MTEVLWLRFAQDTSLPDQFGPDAQGVLDKIFDPDHPHSPWNEALALLGLRRTRGRLLRWVHGVPYINWGEMVGAVSAGCVVPIPDSGAENGYGYRTQYSPSSLLALLKLQWSVSTYVQRCKAMALPEERRDQIIQSLALGLAILALTLRLPAHDEEMLARWMRRPPAKVRRSINQIVFLQKRRTALTPVWQSLFPGGGGGDLVVPCPPHFWGEPPDVVWQVGAMDAESDRARQWRGLAVCGDDVVARVVMMDGVPPNLDQLTLTGDPLVLVFARARPETVEWFPFARAVLYGEGGALSHACTIAREANLPCITALGPAFLSDMRACSQAGASVWLRISPDKATVTRIDR